MTMTILAGDDWKNGIAKTAEDYYKRRDIYCSPATELGVLADSTVVGSFVPFYHYQCDFGTVGNSIIPEVSIRE